MVLFSGKTGSQLFQLYGDSSGDWFGYGLGGIGDVDRDGYPDLIVGAPFSDSPAVHAGFARVISGRVLLVAAYRLFGAGCAAPKATPPSLRATSLPIVGKTFALQLDNLKKLSGGLMVFGGSDKTWRGKPLPLNLAFMGMPKCSLLVSWDLTAPVFTLKTSTTWKILVPMDSGLLGVEFFNQLWIQDASANAAGIAVSNGGRGVVGR